MANELYTALLFLLGTALGLFSGMALTHSRIKKKPLVTKKGTFYYVTKNENEGTLPKGETDLGD